MKRNKQTIINIIVLIMMILNPLTSVSMPTVYAESEPPVSGSEVSDPGVTPTKIVKTKPSELITARPTQFETPSPTDITNPVGTATPTPDESIGTTQTPNSTQATITPTINQTITGTVEPLPSVTPTIGFIKPTFQITKPIKLINLTPEVNWIDAPEQHPTIWLQLWRSLEENLNEPVPDAKILKIEQGLETPSWNRIEANNTNGLAYQFSVKLVDETGQETSLNNYLTTITGLVITNKFVQTETKAVEAFLQWRDQEYPDQILTIADFAADLPTIWFALYRSIPGSDPVLVTGAPFKELPAGTYSAVWEGMPLKDLIGNQYTYTIRQIDANGQDFTPENFRNETEGLTSINYYVEPEDNTDLDFLGGIIEPNFSGIFYPPSTTKMSTNSFGLMAIENPGDVENYKTASPVDGMVNTWDITLEIRAKDVQTTSDTVLVIDRSGSMSGTKMTNAKNAANTFIDLVLPQGNTGNNRIALVSFAGDVTVNSGFSSNATALKTAVNGLTAVGGTYTQLAVHQAAALLVTSTATYKQIVFLSDGRPTYSVQLNNPDDYLIAYSNLGWQTSAAAPATAYNYSTRVGNGGYMMFKYADPPGNANDKYYNHGNSAIAEAGFAKGSGYTVYTIALEAGTTGTPVLNAMASPGKAYSASSADLNAIYSQIAGEILSAARDISVSDPMGMGFTVAGNVTTLTPSQGTATYDPGTKTISWNAGSLSSTTACPPGTASDIKCAKLTYRIEIDDSILDVDPIPTDGLYPTNGNASFTYKDYLGNPQSQSFPVPKVNPVLYTLEKVLKDYTGNIISPDPISARTFKIKVNSSTTDSNFPMEITLKAGQKRVFTNLRWGGTYTIEEISVFGYTPASLNDYTITYSDNGSFTVVNDQTEDKNMVVTNQEKEVGKLTISKIYKDINGNTIDNIPFNFNVTCPDLPGEICPSGITNPITVNSGSFVTIENLPLLKYQVTEINIPADVHAEVTPAGGVVTLTMDSREGNVTYTNYVNKVVGSGLFHKVWNGGPSNPYPDVCFQLMVRDDVQPPGAFTATGTIFRLDYGQTPSGHDGIAPHWHYSIENLPLSRKAIPTDPSSATILYEYMVQEGSCEENLSNFVPFPNNAPENYTSTYTNEKTNDFGTPNVYDVFITNTYVPPSNGSFTAEKIWIDGPAKPTIYFQLYRKTTTMENAEAFLSPVPLDGVAESSCAGTCGYEYEPWKITWKDLPVTDFNGNLYTYSFFEGPSNNPFTPGPIPNYTQAYSGDGKSVTNTYKSPTSNISGYKLWDPSTFTNKPSITLELWRELSGTEEKVGVGILDGIVDTNCMDTGCETAAWVYTWKNMDQTNSSGVPYTYYIVENPVPANFTASYSQDRLTVTNKYSSPLDSVSATKVWSGGPTPRPDIWFKLYRQIDGGTVVEVPLADAPIKKVDPVSLSVSWSNLPMTDNDGITYIYSVIEGSYDETTQIFTPGAPTNYSVAYTNSASLDGITATNTYNSPTSAVTATKVWMPVDLLDSLKVPVTFQLYRYTTDSSAATKVGDPVVLNAGSNWKYTWPNLPETDGDGNVYTYYVIETTVPPNFTADDVNDLSVTNTYSSPTNDVTATKVWKPDNLLDSLKVPVTFQLWRYTTDSSAATTVGDPVVLNADNGWSYTWPNLPKTDANGNTYTYYVVETTVPTNFTADTVNDLSVTNTYKSPTNEVTAAKVWMPVDLLETLKVPVKFQLWRYTTDINNAVTVGSAVTLDGQIDNPCALTGCEEIAWKYTWYDLPKTDLDGNIYTYYVTEVDPPANFSQDSVKDLSVTNTYTSPTNEVTATKVWKPDNLLESLKVPVTFQLYRYTTDSSVATTVGDPVVLNAGSNWKYTWPNLPETDGDGNVYTYYVIETTVPPNFTADDVNDLSVTNTYSSPTNEVTATKVWKPDNLLDSLKVPVTFQLYRYTTDSSAATTVGDPVVLNANNGWSYTWLDLPKTDANGNTYTYYVVETTVPTNFTADDVNDLSVTNTYSSPTNEVTATKVWKPDNLLDSLKVPVTFQLYRYTTDSSAATTVGDPVVLNANNGWSYTWLDLPKTDANGNTYTYYVVETTVPTNFTADDVNDLSVTNTYKSPTNEVTAAKVWMPVDLLETLKVPVKFQLWRYTTDINNAVTVGSAVTLDGQIDNPCALTGCEEIAWKYTWYDLPKTDLNGNTYTYYVTEVDPPANFSQDSVKDLSVTNTYSSPISAVTATKVWMPVDLLDSLKVPVTFQLYRYTTDSSVATTVGDPVELNANNGWTYTWPNLPETDANGNIYTYYVIETTVPTNFTADDINDLSVTNTYSSPTNDVTATKVWKPDNLLDSLKVPVTFQLYRYTTDSSAATTVGDPVVLNADNGWSYTWPNLPKTDANGNTYTYYVIETTVPTNFTADDINDLSVTNTYSSPLDKVEATKVWMPVDLLESLKVTVKFQLWRYTTDINNAVTVGSAVTLDGQIDNPCALTGCEEIAWKYTWYDLPKTDPDGNTYTYYVTEVDPPANFSQDSVKDLSVTNTYSSPHNKVEATKVWAPEGLIDSLKVPVEFQLYRYTTDIDNAVTVGDLVTLDGQIDNPCGLTGCEEIAWKYTWYDLPTTDPDGNTYTYYVVETTLIPNFITDQVKDLVVTNTYAVPDLPDGVSATKNWMPVDLLESLKVPVTFQLYRYTTDINNAVAVGDPVTLDGKVDDPCAVTGCEKSPWIYTWTGLKTSDDYGNAYNYYVVESPVPDNFTADTDKDLVVTNTYNSQPELVKAYKVWKPDSLADSLKVPVTFQLYRITNSVTETVGDPVTLDGQIDTPCALTGCEEAAWEYTWYGLKKTDEKGNPYKYYVLETNTIPSFIKTEKDLVVTNTYQPPFVPDLTNIVMKKVWSGGSAPYPVVYLQLFRQIGGEAPEKVTQPIRLDGVKDENCQSACETSPWEITVLGLPAQNADGKTYTYTVKEVDANGNDFVPEGYSKSINGLTVTNSRLDPKRNITATKTWQYGPSIKPTIQFQLYRNGVKYGDPVDLPNGVTSYTWEGLDRWDSSGKPYVYTVDEVKVPAGYTKTISGMNITNTYKYSSGVIIPVTGDQSKAPLYGLLSLASLIGFGFILLLKRRKPQH